MNAKTNLPNFGPNAKLPAPRDFSEISKQVYQIYRERVTPEVLSKLRPVEHLFIRKLYLAESTSFAIGLLTSWVLTLPALALGRIRLEQTIVCSYIIHEDISIGLEPYVKYIPINEYKNTNIALSNSGIASRLDVDIDKLQKEAVNAQEEFTPGFEIDRDKFERKWTRYDLCSMAKQRDKLTENKSPISKDSLERDYVSFYKASSSIVHSDCSAISHAYLNVFSTSKDEMGVLMPNPSWAIMCMSFTSRYDIVQVYEVLNLLGFDCEKEFIDLRERWLELVKKYI